MSNVMHNIVRRQETVEVYPPPFRYNWADLAYVRKSKAWNLGNKGGGGGNFKFLKKIDQNIFS